jgi:hypothetical protein
LVYLDSLCHICLEGTGFSWNNDIFPKILGQSFSEENKLGFGFRDAQDRGKRVELGSISCGRSSLLQVPKFFHSVDLLGAVSIDFIELLDEWVIACSKGVVLILEDSFSPLECRATETRDYIEDFASGTAVGVGLELKEEIAVGKKSVSFGDFSTELGSIGDFGFLNVMAWIIVICWKCRSRNRSGGRSGRSTLTEVVLKLVNTTLVSFALVPEESNFGTEFSEKVNDRSGWVGRREGFFKIEFLDIIVLGASSSACWRRWAGEMVSRKWLERRSSRNCHLGGLGGLRRG